MTRGLNVRFQAPSLAPLSTSLRTLAVVAKLSRNGARDSNLLSEAEEISMTKWRPWIIGISLLASGLLLFLVGYFSRQFSGPIIPEVASRSLLLTGFALGAVHSISGFNRFVWSIRANFNDAEIRRLKELRTYGALAFVPIGVGLTLPLISSAFRPLWGEVPHDAVVIFSIVLTAFGLLFGGLNRVAEFRLLKQSATRTSDLAP